jgi:hypothetical protein
VHRLGQPGDRGDVAPIGTTVRPRIFAAKPSVPRPRTASIASPWASMTRIVSDRSQTSAGVAATAAPATRSGSHRSGLRFQTTSGVPARAR